MHRLIPWNRARDDLCHDLGRTSRWLFTPFEAIKQQFDLNESQVILLMRGSFRLWRERVSGRATKHLKLRNPDISRGYCPTQYKQR